MRRVTPLLLVISASVLIVLFAPREALPHDPVSTTVQYNREVVAILNTKCVQCHAPGGMAMSLTTYGETRPWAEAIKEEVLARRMPPWPAVRGYGEFANDIGLTSRELDFLVSWAEGGAPEGDGVPPQHMDHSGHWMLGEPDQLTSPAQATFVARGSQPHLARTIVDPGLTRETWIKALDYKPGDRRVTRAAFFSVEGTGEFLGGWTPWQTSVELPDGVAFQLPAGTRIAVDILYRGVSEDVLDTPSLAMYRTDNAKVKATSIEMSGRASGATVRANHPVGEPLTLLAMRSVPGAAVSSLELRERRSDGTIRVLAWANALTSDWQTPLVFKTPVELEAGSVLEAIAHGVSGSEPVPLHVDLTVARASLRPAS